MKAIRKRGARGSSHDTSVFIPDATNAKADLLIVVVAVYIGIVVVQFAVPCVVRIVLCTTPPVAVVANVVVGSIVVAVTAREKEKAMTDLHFVRSARNTVDNKTIPFAAAGKDFTCSVHGRMKMARYP
jgi:hypothetical protein